MDKIIIGLVGGKKSGKSTVSKMLKGKGFTEIMFAEPLKMATACMLGVSAKWLLEASYDEKENIVPGYSFSYRDFMQKLGTDFIRNKISKTFWLDIVRNKIRNENHKRIIISDVRFDNEAMFIINEGGIVIDIDRDLITNDYHESEKGISRKYIAHKVNNTKDVKHLLDCINEIIYKEYKIK